jgi:hypothetical protein
VTGDLLRRIAALLVLMIAVLCGPTLLAQVSEAAGAAVPTAAEAPGTWSLVWAFFSASALEWLKRKPALTLITETSAFWAQRVLGILLAIAATLGIQWTFDSAAGTLVVTGLTIGSVTALALETVKTWVYQEITYRVAIRNYRPGAQAEGIRLDGVR